MEFDPLSPRFANIINMTDPTKHVDHLSIITEMRSQGNRR